MGVHLKVLGKQLALFISNYDRDGWLGFIFWASMNFTQLEWGRGTHFLASSDKLVSKVCTPTVYNIDLSTSDTRKYHQLFNPCTLQLFRIWWTPLERFSGSQPGIVSNSANLITVGLRNLSRLHPDTRSSGIEFWEQLPAQEPVN